MAFVGLPFIPFDRVRDDGPGQHLGGADTNARHDAQEHDDPERRLSRNQDEDDHNHRPKRDTDDIGQAFVPMTGCPVPERQRENGGDENTGHDEAALTFTLDDVFDIKEQVGLNDQDSHPGEQVDARTKYKRPVFEGRLERRDEFGLFLTNVFTPFTRPQEDANQGGGGNSTCDDAHEEHPARVFGHH